MIACFVRYEIDPIKRNSFEEYARNWGQAIPRCGADLIGYYSPHEGSSTVAYGVYNIESLAAYEAYRSRLAADPIGRENYAFAQREAFYPARGPTVPQAGICPARAKGIVMIGVIFEVEPADGKRERYLELAAGLRSQLEQSDGFISIERFQSLSEPGKILSLSFFRDEAAVRAWRSATNHRDAQREGRDDVFSEYRLRVVEVIRDYV